MYKNKLVSITVVLFFLMLFSIIPICTATASLPKINYKDSKLAIDVKDVKLEEILSRVADLADIRIVFYGTTQQLITMEMDFTPIEQALKRLLAKSAFSFIYTEKKNTLGQLIPVIKEVVIIPEKAGMEKVFSSSNDQAGIPGPPEQDIVAEAATMVPVSPTIADSSNTETEIYGKGVFIKLEPRVLKSMTGQTLFSGANSMTAALDPDLSRKSGIEQDQNGLQIQSLEEETALEDLGLKQGDVIREINGEPIADSAQADATIQKILTNKEDTRMRIEVEREKIIEHIYVELN